MKRLWKALMDLLYPPKCVFCRKLLGRDEEEICNRCRLSLPVYTEKLEPGPYCSDGVAALYYEDQVRDSLLRFKFQGMEQYAPVYGKLLAAACAQLPLDAIDAVTWVPVSRRRRRRRGYDQAQLLAKSLAGELNKPLRSTLTKIRDNRAQSSIESAEARRANVLGVYAGKPEAAGETLLLVDDIVTTGATSSEAARTLLTAGASAVYLAAMAARRQQD